MSAFFITATGTGTGKTFITSGLIRCLIAKGHVVRGLKPVLSGYDVPAGSDSAMLLEAMGEPVSDEAVARISPYRFKAPLSPDMAAALESRRIDFEELLGFCRAGLQSAGTVLIEGVGGVMVPLDQDHTTLDLMAALGLPVVLVAGSYLGSISHTLTAAAALQSAGVEAITLVVNDTGAGEGPGNIPLADTAATLHRFLPHHEIVTLPRNPASIDFAPVAASMFREKDKAARISSP